MDFSKFLFMNFERSRDNQEDTFLFLNSAEIQELDLYLKRRLRQDNKRIPVKAFNLDTGKWNNVDPLGGVIEEGTGGGGPTPGTLDHEDLLGLQGGAVNNRYHLTLTQLNKLNQGNYQGDWNALTNTPSIPLPSASNKDQFYRVTTAGTTLINGVSEWEVGDLIYSTGTFWFRIASGLSAKTAKHATEIEITLNQLANTVLSVHTSGIGYIKSGDNGHLGNNASEFNSTEYIQVFRNGAYQRKGVNVNYVSSSSLSFNVPLKVGEFIVILS
jgi:hypothetical protein